MFFKRNFVSFSDYCVDLLYSGILIFAAVFSL